MGNLCCKPSTLRTKPDTASDSGTNDIFLQSLEPEGMDSCDFCPFLQMQEFEVVSDIKVKVDVNKGSLILESISFWLKSPNKWCQNPEHLLFR